MRGRAIALLATIATFVVVVSAGMGVIASAAPTSPRITLSTDAVAPGQRVLIRGTGWPAGFDLSATLCGANAVNGSVSCAQTTTVPLVAGAGGEVWSWMTASLPPAPCPCVILISGVTNPYSRAIPVTVLGASTAPVPPVRQTLEPDLRINDLRVVAKKTLASSMGGAALRTVELSIYNASSVPWTPHLIGRWGKGTGITHVISMPSVGSMAPGSSTTIRAPFSLPALSVGTYAVRVVVLVVGFQHQGSAMTSTSQWPVGLFILIAVVLILLVWLVVTLLRRRARRRASRAAQGDDLQPVSPEATEAPEPPESAPLEPPGDQIDEPGSEPLEVKSSPGS